jgi:hypothetical protein
MQSVLGGFPSAYAVAVLQIAGDLLAKGRLHHFFEITSCSIVLSSVRSATSFLRRTFSSRSWRSSRISGVPSCRISSSKRTWCSRERLDGGKAPRPGCPIQVAAAPPRFARGCVVCVPCGPPFAAQFEPRNCESAGLKTPPPVTFRSSPSATIAGRPRANRR